MAAVAPIAHQLERAYNIDDATVGLLSGIPVFCYAAFSPLASVLIKKIGLEKTFITCVLAGMFAVILRSVQFGGFSTMLVATIIMGASVALGNISIPLIAARDFKKNFALVTGLASATMNLGNMFAFAFTVPLVNLLGSYVFALLCWVFVDITVLVVWLIYYYRRIRGKSRKALRNEGYNLKEIRIKNKQSKKLRLEISKEAKDKMVEERNIYKLPITYCLIFIFIAQCFGFFGLSAWLPSIFHSLNFDEQSAGYCSSLFQFVGIIGSVLVQYMLKKLDYFRSFIIIGLAWFSLPFGLLLIPKLWFIWIAFAGFAQAANYILVFAKINSYTATTNEARKLSAIVQICAYLVAGVTPTFLGYVFQMVQNWNVPLIIVSLVMFFMLICGGYTYKKW